MPSAILLVVADQSPVLILVVEQLLIRVERFLFTGFEVRIELALAVEHLDIAIVDQIAQDPYSGIPFEVFVDRAFHIARHTDQIAFILIEHTRAILVHIHFLGLLVPGIPILIILGLIAVEAVEIAHSIRQIGGIEGETMIGDEVFGIVVETEYTMVLGRISAFEIDRVDILGVLLAVAIVIDIG